MVEECKKQRRRDIECQIWQMEQAKSTLKSGLYFIIALNISFGGISLAFQKLNLPPEEVVIAVAVVGIVVYALFFCESSNRGICYMPSCGSSLPKAGKKQNYYTNKIDLGPLPHLYQPNSDMSMPWKSLPGSCDEIRKDNNAKFPKVQPARKDQRRCGDDIVMNMDGQLLKGALDNSGKIPICKDSKAKFPKVQPARKDECFCRDNIVVNLDGQVLKSALDSYAKILRKDSKAKFPKVQPARKIQCRCGNNIVVNVDGQLLKSALDSYGKIPTRKDSKVEFPKEQPARKDQCRCGDNIVVNLDGQLRKLRKKENKCKKTDGKGEEISIKERFPVSPLTSTMLTEGKGKCESSEVTAEECWCKVRMSKSVRKNLVIKAQNLQS